MNHFLRSKHILAFIGVFVAMVGCFSLSQAVFGQSDTFGLNEFNQTTVLQNQDIRITIARIINAVLMVLGIIALGLVLYAGFLWMTAGGSEDKIAQAKKILINAVIGLAIIMSSLAIVNYVMNVLKNATGIEETELSGSCEDPGYAASHLAECRIAFPSSVCEQNPGACLPPDTFVVKSLTPRIPGTDALSVNNVVFRAVFSLPVATAAGDILTIRKDNEDVTNQFSFAFVDDTVLEATPKASAGCANTDRCIPSGRFTVTVKTDTVKSKSRKSLETRVGNTDYPITVTFDVDENDALDVEKPQIKSLRVNGENSNTHVLARGKSYPLVATLTDNRGIGYVRVTLTREGGEPTVAYDGPRNTSNASLESPYSFHFPLVLAANTPLKKTVLVSVTAYDVDHGSTTVTTSLFVVANHCGNGVKDQDEVAVDVGPSCQSEKGCARDVECISGVCDETRGQCIARPLITDVSPTWDGAPGNWITIEGNYFGTVPGKVEFGYDTNNDQAMTDADTWIEARMPACGTGTTWTERTVVVEIPTENQAAINTLRVDNPLKNFRAIRLVKQKVQNTDPDLLDSTVDDIGPRPGPQGGYFSINSVKRPGLCRVVTADNKSAAIQNTDVTATGSGFGTQPTGDNGGLYFGGFAGPLRQWSNTAIGSRVPANLNPADVSVEVRTNGERSNRVRFTVLPVTGDVLPVIESIDPSTTTPGSYVTVYGQRFGDTPNQVWLAPRPGMNCANGVEDGCVELLTTLPATCGDTWKNDQVIALIPRQTATDKTYYVVLKTAVGLVTDGQDQLTIVKGEPLPSICSLTPDQGPSPLPVGSRGIHLTGVNFSNQPTVYFWTKGSRVNDLSSWLSARTGGNILLQVGDTDITTLLPVTSDGYSMQTGPIRVVANGKQSNSVRYTVFDCRESKTLPEGYQCCSTGPDAGVLKRTDLTCTGETRDAGYVWRFTTGKIPHVPFIVEECNEIDWNNVKANDVFPSPTPWQARKRGKEACLNSSIAVRFSMDMDDKTITADTVKLFRCTEKSDGTPDCTGRNKEAVNDIQRAYGARVLTIRSVPPAQELTPNTWYRVELSDRIQSTEDLAIAGRVQTFTQPLQKTRPCGEGTAYCFEFRTGNGRCTVTSAGIIPATYTTRLLGLVANPAGSENPYYYYVWGKGNQECSVISVDGMGWQWTSDNKAKVTPAPGPRFTDSRATVEALEDSGGQSVKIKADVVGQTKVTTNTLSVLQTLGFSNGVEILKSADVKTAAYQTAFDFKTNKQLVVSYTLNDISPSTTAFRVVNSPAGPIQEKTRYLFIKSGKDGVEYEALVTERIYPDKRKERIFQFNHFIETGGYLSLKDVIEEAVWKGSPRITYTVRFIDGKLLLYRNGQIVPLKDFTFPLKLRSGALIVGGGNSVGTDPLLGTIHTLQFEEQALGIVGSVHVESDLYITLGEPTVGDRWPNCTEACTNASIGMMFSRQMMTSTYENGVTLEKCSDDSCERREGIAIEKVSADPLTFTFRPSTLLETNTWYLVSASPAITSVGRILPDGTIVAGPGLVKTETWKFKTKETAGVCGIDRVVVQPDPFTARQIGQQTRYAATPLSAPDACSPRGQALDPWQYGWRWSTADTNVATVSTFESKGIIPSYCSLGCTLEGSSIPRGANHDYLCGNNRLDSGEDCDIAMAGEVPGVSCTLSCLRPGNKNKGTGPNQCGNRTVDTAQGEECDPAQETIGRFCTDECTRKPSPTTLTANDPQATLCGQDGRSIRGGVKVEECDPSDPDSRVRCSSSCLNLGTNVAASWCATRSSGTSTIAVACLKAKSVCGDGEIDAGEECEVGKNGATEATCNTRCLLQHVCNDTELKQCDKNQVGCNDDCTFAGSSVIYAKPSLCGDGIPGDGEDSRCEVESTGASFGQNPIQVVRAVGNGNVATSTQVQRTDIRAMVTSYRNPDGTVNASMADVLGEGEYALQCGYTETNEPKPKGNTVVYNDCPDPAFGVGKNSCCYMRPKRESEYPVDGAGLAGARSVPDDVVASASAFRQTLTAVDENVRRETRAITQNVAAAVNTLRLAVQGPEKKTTGTGENKQVGESSSVQPNNQSEVQRQQERERARQEYNDELVQLNTALQTAQTQLTTLRASSVRQLEPRVTVFRTKVEEFATNLSVVNIAEVRALEARLQSIDASLRLVNVNDILGRSLGQSFTDFATAVQDYQGDYLDANDIQQITNLYTAFEQKVNAGQFGLPVAKVVGDIENIVAEVNRNATAIYPAGPVCKNTYIAVNFDGPIQKESLFNNILIAKGYTNQVTCEANGETDVTQLIRSSIALRHDTDMPQGFWERMWSGVRQFFARLLGKDAYASMFKVDTVRVWCSGKVRAVPEVSSVVVAGKTVTTVRLGLSQLLDGDAIYAVFLKGGKSGIIDTQGVGIASKDAPGKLDDVWIFKTGNEICKIDSVSLTPETHLFTAPNTSVGMTAFAQSRNGFISSIPGQYEWVWSWGPQGHPVFAIPAPNAPTNTTQTTVAVKTVEGSGLAIATARVVTDVDVSNQNHRGRVFSGSAQLTAQFCEHPWPSRESYPYRLRVGTALTELNVSMGYCADAGIPGRTDDDLPFLSPVSLTDARDGEILKLLFVDETSQTDDAIGLRVFPNGKRFTAREWYKEKFPNADVSTLRSVSIGGYDGVTDGNTYYINFLNHDLNNNEVYNNILVLSLNTNASPDMRTVLDLLIDSMKFNTNLTDVGYCMLRGQSLQGDPTATSQTASCTTDFDCRDNNGLPKDGLSGQCSNVKTKFLRDWRRLQDIRTAQNRLEAYKNTNGGYPLLQSGTYIPQYSVTYWPSWGKLSQDVGGLPQDPVNRKTACEDPRAESQTCWNAASSTYSCPGYASVYEYSVDPSTNRYTLHGTLEYFTAGDKAVTEFVSSTHFSTDPWCVPTERHSPFAARCGDGVVNPGESCDDPSGTARSSQYGKIGSDIDECPIGQVATRFCNTQCQLEYTNCANSTRCGNGIVEQGELCDDGALNGTYGHCTEYTCTPPAEYCGDRKKQDQEFCDKALPTFGIGFCSNVHAPECNGNRTGEWLVKELTDWTIVDVDFVNTSTGWLLATQSRQSILYKTENGGRSWVESSTTPNSVYFTKIQFLDERNGWAIGKAQVQGKPDRLYRTTDGGIRWNFVEVTENVREVFFVNQKVGWAVGTVSGDMNRGVIWKTIDGGVTWTIRKNTPELQPTDELGKGLNSVFFVNEQTGWVIGTDFILKTVDGGGSWSLQDPETEGTALQSLYFLNANTGFIAAPGGVLKTVNGGTRWTATNGPNLRDIKFFNAQYGVAVGTRGDIFRTTDGGQTWSEVASGVEETLLSLDIITPDNIWVVGGGGTLLRNYADCQVYACSSDVACGTGNTCIAPGNPSYHLYRQNSCAWDCRTPGGYCGDNVKQDLEQCEDGNTTNGDGCSQFCRTEPRNQSVAVAREGERCGDTIVQAHRGEVCDAGATNGEPCVPGYGRSCSYCSNDCKNVLTIDASSRCGNGELDRIGTSTTGIAVMEACDVLANGKIVSSTPNGGQVILEASNNCAPKKGSYQCNATCTQLVNNCVACGTINNGGAIPKLAVLNVLVSSSTMSDRQTIHWATTTRKGMYMGNTSLGASYYWSVSTGTHKNSTFPAKTYPRSVDHRNFMNQQWIFADENQFPLDFPYLYTDPQTPTPTTRGIETNPMCTGEYKLFFGNLGIKNTVEGQGKRWTNFMYGDFFDYPVNGEGSIVENELVISPLVMPGQIRAVVRWPVNDQRIRLSGMVYNQGFSGDPRIIGYTKALEQADTYLCNKLKFDSYWTPNCTFYHDKVAVHDIGQLKTVSAHAVTINYGLETQNSPLLNTTYAFFVQGISGPMGLYTGQDIYVDVYVGDKHKDAIPKYSIFKPDYTFALKAANAGGNPQALFWHVFNITKDGSVFTVNTSTTGMNGTLRTDFAAVQCNVQGDVCVTPE
ncbi:MAG TPA: YCF48-related protein [Candidatus Kapabacteria bacterium]|nr:YCF48-related protein [Candidatus Kapabacteria bacterium]